MFIMYASNIKQEMGQIYANHMSPLPFGCVSSLSIFRVSGLHQMPISLSLEIQQHAKSTGRDIQPLLTINHY